MKKYTRAEIDSLIERFEACCLPKAEWTHEAHLVVAVWYCSQYPLEEALPIVRRRITEHNTSVGTPNTDEEGYHESITKFWLLVANDFLKANPPASKDVLANALIESPQGSSAYPLEFYSAERLFSALARRTWVAPDRKPFTPRP